MTGGLFPIPDRKHPYPLQKTFPHLVPPMTLILGLSPERKRCIWSTTPGPNPDPGSPFHSHAAPIPMN